MCEWRCLLRAVLGIAITFVAALQPSSADVHRHLDSGASDDHNSRFSQHVPRDLIPLCSKVLSQLNHSEVALLRDATQRKDAMLREERYAFLMFERAPHIEEKKVKEDYEGQYKGWKLAYSSNLSENALKAIADATKAKLDAERGKIDALLAVIRARGALDAKITRQQVCYCVIGRVNQRLWTDHPVVSFLLQYYKRPQIVWKYAEQLSRCQAVIPSELVVNVDGSDEADTWAWVQFARNTSGFVVPVISDNVHEIRGYNRIMETARGQYMVLLQDDELPLLADCSWLPNMVKLFERFPNVGLMGLKGYNYGRRSNYDNQTGMHFRDPVTKIPIQYVQLTDYAPMAVRKAAWLYIGGIDETLAAKGKCGIWSDWEFVTRMWVAGWHVAYHQVDRVGDGQPGGTHTSASAERCWGMQQYLASSIYVDRFDGELQDMLTGRVRRMNLDGLEPIDPKICPFGGGCDPKTYQGF